MTKTLLNIIQADFQIKQIVETIKLIDYEELFLTGGALRNRVWNYFHEFNSNYEIFDCDVIYYNNLKIEKKYDLEIERHLKHLQPSIQWSVKNQARMHLKHNRKQYANIAEALSASPETCSAVAVSKKYSILSPLGTSDLLEMRIRQNPYRDSDNFEKRLHNKGWLTKWSQLKLA